VLRLGRHRRSRRPGDDDPIDRADRTAYVGAGGGITWLSDPEEEVAEVGLKARPLAALGANLPPGW
jgi:hypothetical protein